MSEMRFTEEHEWLSRDDSGNITIGITDYAQEQLGDVVYVELPQVGATVAAGDEVAVVESVKAAGDIKVAVAGTVTEINERLQDEPELVNQSPQGDGWFLKLSPDNADGLDNFMDEAAYKEFVSKL